MRHRSAVALVRWVVVLAVVGGLAAAGWRYGPGLLRPSVSVTDAVDAPIVQAFYATGTLLPEREYSIKANNPGFLTRVLVDKGDRVRKDQPLAVVNEDAVQFRFDHAQAERNLKAALAADDSPVLKEFDAKLTADQQLSEIAQREQDRLVKMMAASAASQADLDRALDRVKMLWSETESLKSQRVAKKLELARDLEVAEAALKVARWNLDRQTVLCPIDNAVVLDRPLTVGTRVAVNDHLMQVADVRPESLVMRSQVDEEDKTLVDIGRKVLISLYAYADQPGKGVKSRIFTGKVKRIYDKADSDRRTFEVDVEMDEKDPGFSAGMTGELEFIVAEKRGLVVPSQAVQNGQIWLVRGGRLTKTAVTLGIRSIERTEVISGVAAGDRVVVSPLDGPREGQAVSAAYVDPETAAAANRPKETEAVRFFK